MESGIHYNSGDAFSEDVKWHRVWCTGVWYEGRFAALSAPLYNYVDGNGTLLSSKPFDEASPFNEGLALVKNYQAGDDDYKVIKEDGGVALTIKDSEFQRVEPFSQGLAAVMDKTGMWGYIDLSGKTVIPRRYSAAGPFKDDEAEVMQNGSILRIDKSGEVISEAP